MPESKQVRTISSWVLVGVLAAIYAGAGLAKVMGAEEMVRNFQEWGYGDGFRIFIGLCELAGCVGLLIPPVATWAAGGLICVMAGAVFTHLSHGLPNAWIPASLLIALGVVAYLRRHRALFIGALFESTPQAPSSPAAPGSAI